MINVKKECGYDAIVERICKTIKNKVLNAHDKLQPEMELAISYNSSIYNVRKALKILKERNILYSVPKVGMFVAPVVEEVQEISSVITSNTEKIKSENPNCIRFLASDNDLIMSIYSNIQDEFNSKSHFVDVQIENGYLNKRNKVDIWVCDSPLHSFQYDDIDNVDFSCLDNTLNLLKSNVVTIYNTIPLLFFNKEILEKYNIARPSYKTFDEQIDFIDEVISKTMDMKIPGVVIHPIQLLGNSFFEMIDDITNGKTNIDDFIDKYKNVVDKTTYIFRKYKMSQPLKKVENYNAFVGEKSPMFLSYSKHFYKLSKSDFVDCYPLLSFDNKVKPFSMGAVMNNDIDYPIEGVRFLKHLQSSLCQREFAKCGLLPIDKRDYNALPYSGFNDLLESGLDKPIMFQSNKQQYIGINIINVELWDIILNDKSIEDALENCFQFSYLYINMQFSKKNSDKHNQLAKIYT